MQAQYGSMKFVSIFGVNRFCWDDLRLYMPQLRIIWEWLKIDHISPETRMLTKNDQFDRSVAVSITQVQWLLGLSTFSYIHGRNVSAQLRNLLHARLYRSFFRRTLCPGDPTATSLCPLEQLAVWDKHQSVQICCCNTSITWVKHVNAYWTYVKAILEGMNIRNKKIFLGVFFAGTRVCWPVHKWSGM